MLTNSTVAMAGIARGYNYSQIEIFHNNLLSVLFFKEEKVDFFRKFDDQYHQIYQPR